MMSDRRYRGYLIFFLMLILTFNYLDRMVLAVTLEAIKVDLKLTDTQLGMLSGIAFAFFYSIMGIPIARWTDRGDRRWIVGLTTGLWSVGVVLSGFAANFVQMLMIRIGIGIGEAGGIPTAHSLIGDHFERHERARAVGRYMFGLPLSMLLGYLLGGLLSDLYGWRMTFILLGLPGLALALLAIFTLREPRRDGGAKSGESGEQAPGFGITLRTLWGARTYRYLLVGHTIWYFFGYGVLQWQPSFLVRSHGMSLSAIGLWLALASGVAGIVGSYIGGEWGTRYAAGRERYQLQGVAVFLGLYGVFNFVGFAAPTAWMTLTFFALGQLCGSMSNGPLLATMQTMIPPRMRAMSLAIVFLFANLIGMGLGPVGVGMLSDHFQGWAGDNALRYALLIFCPGYLLLAYCMIKASNTVMDDMARLGAAESAVTVRAEPCPA